MDEDQMIQFNTDAFNGFNENALIPCNFCNRTFLPDSLKIHRKICTADKPFKPLNRKNKKAPVKQQRRAKPAKHDWEDRPIGGKKKKKEPVVHYEESEESMSEEYDVPVKRKQPQKRKANLYKKKPAKKKTRNYYEDSDEGGDSDIINNYSYSRPKRGAHLNKPEKKPSFKKSNYGTGVKKSKYGTTGGGYKKPKNRRPVYEPEESEESIEEYVAPKRKKPAPKRRVKPKAKPKPQKITYAFSGPPANLEPCRICGRSFAEDRIKKHMTICKIQSRKKTKVKRFHKVLTEKEKRKIKKNKGPSKWKIQHQEFVKQMRYMRKLKKVEQQGGDIRSIAPPPPSSQPGLVPCKLCGRKFREQAHARHEKICKTVFGGKKGNNRPKKTKLQRRRGY